MNVMSRSKTWPVVVVRLERGDEDGMLVTEDGPCMAMTDDLMGAVGGAGVVGGGGVTGTTDTCPLAPLSARKRATLQRHYYPEAGWGWVVMATAIAVHVLNHGFQLSAAVTLGAAAVKFGQPVINTGQWPVIYPSSTPFPLLY